MWQICLNLSNPPQGFLRPRWNAAGFRKQTNWFQRVLTFLVDVEILKNNIYLSDFYCTDHFDPSYAEISATLEFEVGCLDGVEWSGTCGDLPRIWNSHDFCRRLNSLPLTKKWSLDYAYVRLWYPCSESGSNVTNGAAIAHWIRERRVEIQKYKNPFDASKAIWMVFL